MRTYSCRLHNRNGTVDRYELGDFATPDEAMRAVRSALLVSLCATWVELWSGDLYLASIDRESAQFRGQSVTGATWSVVEAAQPEPCVRRLA